MASAWSEEENFACPVCLETLKDPATIPCGHSYCLACIGSHWDKEDSKGQYSCPQCRQMFGTRPSLAKNTLLVEAMEKLRANSLRLSSSTAASTAPPSMPIYLDVLPDKGPRKGSMYPQLPTVDPRLCPHHQRPLDLFCHEDKECVCELCSQHGHKGHRLLKPQVERIERQKELVQMETGVQRRIQETEKKLRELPHAAQQHKALLHALEKDSTELFSELVKTMSLTGTQIGDLLRSHQSSSGTKVEGQIHRLEQEVAQLQWKSEELNRLADMQDDICFLKNFLTMEPLDQMGAAEESVLSQQEAVVVAIRSTMKELQESVQDICKANLTKITTLVNHDPMALVTNGAAAAEASPDGQLTSQDTVYEMIMNPPPSPPARPPVHTSSRPEGAVFPQASAPPPPLPPLRPQASSVRQVVNAEPQTREEMLKFRFEPSLDPNTAYQRLLLSDGGRKATMRAENLNPPDHPDRFQFWRQVLCREPLGGSPYYWEVEWTGPKITIGVAYKAMERKGSDNKSRLGHNALSWSLYWSGTGFSFWHDNQEKMLGSPKARRIGIYLDQHAGILSFYRIANNQATLIHRHEGEFTGPLYPGFRFWAGVGATVTVCELD